MKKTMIAAAGLGSAMLFLHACACSGCGSNDNAAPAADAEAVAFNDACPTSGRAVVASVGTVSYKGRNVGFCCAGCKAGWANMDVAKKDAFVAGEG